MPVILTCSNRSDNQTRKKTPSDRLMDLNFMLCVCVHKITHLTFAICEYQNADLLKYNLFEWQIINRKIECEKLREEMGGTERQIDFINSMFWVNVQLRIIAIICTKWLLHNTNARAVVAALFAALRFHTCLWVQKAHLFDGMWLWVCFVCQIPSRLSVAFPEATRLHLKLALQWSGASYCDVFAINPYRYVLNDFN